MRPDTASRLYVTDLDGTLLGADSRVSPVSSAIINRLTGRGALITVATARTPATVEPLLGATVTSAPAIVLTGAGLWDRRTLTFTRLTLLPAADAVRVTGTALRCGLQPLVYRRDSDNRHLLFFNQKGMLSPDRMKFVTDRETLELKRPVACDDIVCEADSPDTVLVLAMGRKEQVIKAVSVLRDDPALSVSYYSDPVYPGVWFLEVFGRGVSKAEGIAALRRLTGASHVTVFGDNYNDLSMMAAADTAVAMANAVDDVKAAADTVIGSNTDDAVARYIAADLGYTPEI